MKVHVKKLEGSWDAGFALDKHTLSSVYRGVSPTALMEPPKIGLMEPVEVP